MSADVIHLAVVNALDEAVARSMELSKSGKLFSPRNSKLKVLIQSIYAGGGSNREGLSLNRSILEADEVDIINKSDLQAYIDGLKTDQKPTSITITEKTTNVIVGPTRAFL